MSLDDHMREFQTTNEHSSCDSLGKIRRTSDSLNEGLPIKWPEKSFKEMIFIP